MSFQAYLDAVEAKTGLTPRQLIGISDAPVGSSGPHREQSDALSLDGIATKLS